MLISEKLARQYLADETQGCAVPVVPQQFRRRRNIEHSYVFFGDVPVRGYKHSNRWGFDEREVRRAGRAVAAVQWEADDAVDTQLPDSEPAWSDQPDWRRDLRRWMSHACVKIAAQGDVLHCVLRCRSQSRSQKQELSAHQVTELVRRIVEQALRDDGAGSAGPAT